MIRGARSRGARPSGVLALVLGLALAPGTLAQEPAGSAASVRERLKAAVDQALAQHVRELRARLHAAIDQVTGQESASNLDELFAELQRSLGGQLDAPGEVRYRGDPGVRNAGEASDLEVPEMQALALLSWHEALGLEGEEPSKELLALHGAPWAGQGLRIGSVRPGSAADLAGLLPGDVVLELDGKAVKVGGPSWQAVMPRVSDEVQALVVRRRDRQRTAVTILMPRGTPLRPASEAPGTDARKLTEELFRKALDQVLGEGQGWIETGGAKRKDPGERR